MNKFKTRFRVHQNTLVLDADEILDPVFDLIHCTAAVRGEENLYRFLIEAIKNNKLQNIYYNELYAAERVKKNSMEFFKVYCHLDKKRPTAYISPEDFKELLEIWIRERNKFDKDPRAYKQEMIRNGAIILYVEDRAKDPEEYDNKVRESKHGIIEETRYKPWWQFWK